jgi:hypothetical protein
MTTYVVMRRPVEVGMLEAQFSFGVHQGRLVKVLLQTHSFFDARHNTFLLHVPLKARCTQALLLLFVGNHSPVVFQGV